MHISQVQAFVLQNVPMRSAPLLDTPLTTMSILVQIQTDDGLIGYGQTTSSLLWGVAAFINRQAGPFLIGKDPQLTGRIWNEMYASFNKRALTGVWSDAMSAIDIALWDIKGQALGQPVWRLLGGASPSVPSYVTFGLPDYTLEQLPEAALHWVRQGHDKLKMVVHSGNPEHDYQRVAAVREAVGPDVELMLDGSFLWSFPKALRLARLCEPLDLLWLEEPLSSQNDPRLLADLRKQTTVPIAAGQNEGHRFRQRDLLTSEAVDYLQPSVLHVGGYTEAARVAGMASAFNIPIAGGGGWGVHNLHLHAGVGGFRVEYHYLRWMMYEAVYEAGFPSPVNGSVLAPEKPGLGLSPKDGIIAEYGRTE